MTNETPAEEAGEPKAEAAKASGRQTGARRPLELVGGMWTFLAAGLLAGALAWTIVQRFDQPFKMPPIQAPSGPTEEEKAIIRRAEFGNAAFVFGVFGGLEAVGFALAEGVTRKRPGFVAVAVLTGLGFGAVFGAAAGAVVKMVFEYPLPESMDEWMRNPNYEMIKTMVVQSVGWGITGLGIGLGLALPTWRRRIVLQTPLAALLGGVVSALVYGFVVALLVKTAQTDVMVPPERWNRLAWFLVTAGLMGLSVGGLGKSRRPTSPATGVPNETGASGTKDEG